jgi:hypothetical protein
VRLTLARSAFFAIALATMMTFATPADACSPMLTRQEERFDSADLIFYGRAVSQDPGVIDYIPYAGRTLDYRIDRTRFTVERTWKGEAPAQLETISLLSMCVRSFQVGTEYLVWAKRMEDGRLAAELGGPDTRPGPPAVGQADYDYLEEQRARAIAAGYPPWGTQPRPGLIEEIAGRTIEFPPDAHVVGYLPEGVCPTSDCWTARLKMGIVRGRSYAWIWLDTGMFDEQLAPGDEHAFDFLRDVLR